MRLFASLLFLPLLLNARDIPVSDEEGLAKAIKEAQPGDNIILREGEWKDVLVKFKGQGTPDAPITLRAASPGETVFTGASGLRIAGEHLVVDGIWFKNPDPSIGDSIEFRLDSKNLARHCRLTNCAMTLDPTLASKDEKESHWVGIYGSDNRIDRCLLKGKASKGTTLVVWLGGDNLGQHIIEQNYFGPREKLGKNGGETIRIGDSKNSMQKASCVIRRNLFERCNGEAECISNKSCGNLYQENTFVEVSGTLTLRHGNGCTVEKNGFFGNHAGGTGGIRIIGEDHVVKGNYLENLAGDEVRSGITFMMGLPDSPLNGYFQVKRARVENNTLVDCEQPFLIALEGDKVPGKPTQPPVDCVIQGNKVHSPKATVIDARGDLSGVKWQDNQFYGKELGIPTTEGIAWGKEPVIKKLTPILPSEAGPVWWK
ncbi:poly(beta-D-mannuronate) lyase [Prosthecobacter fusiformis]|uniref:Poly(Beta-D-mannuronate) lyase n=1 Tax=Prosthecobacter fusiformis TaxID=48464 RepID=A0A4R7RXT2_9BACT|nr:polysaccharide lyase 6 family protein [Prosthecobacter fusiformis]TDU69387.1 poly(beta-D-mannuronate) lyase [Prosthecobacter fusiformis]